MDLSAANNMTDEELRKTLAQLRGLNNFAHPRPINAQFQRELVAKQAKGGVRATHASTQ